MALQCQDVLRSELKFALTCQPGKDSPALDSDGDHVVPISFFKGTALEFHESGYMRFVRNCITVSSSSAVNNQARDRYMGVNLCEFHRWGANKVHRIGPDFTPPDDVVGCGRLGLFVQRYDVTASKIHYALSEWAQ